MSVQPSLKCWGMQVHIADDSTDEDLKAGKEQLKVQHAQQNTKQDSSKIIETLKRFEHILA